MDQLKTLFDLKLVAQNQYPFSKGWLVNKSEVLKKVKLKKVRGVSVNEITTSKQKMKFYTEKHLILLWNQWKVLPCIMYV